MLSDDVNPKGVLGFLGILVLTLVVIYTVAAGTLRHLQARAAAQDARTPLSPLRFTRSNFPGPREQPAPLGDLIALRAREEADINGYGWINQTAGIVRIPIDRAIELLTQPGGKRP